MQVHGACVGTLYTSYWHPEVRSFSAVGEYVNKRLLLHDKLFPNTDYGLNGRHITIATNYVSVCN